METLQDNLLELTILLYQKMQDRELDAGELSGIVPQEDDFQALTTRLGTDLINADESTRRLMFHVPGSEFFADMDGLLTNPARRLKPPCKFYLADIDYLFQGDVRSAPVVVRNYFAATALYALLAKISDHQGGVPSGTTLIFLQKEKIEITSLYSKSDLQDLAGLDDFKSNFIESETHQEQKKTIVKTVLLAMFAGHKRINLADLLSNFSDFVEKVQASYQLYVAEFSFLKIKAEVEKEKLDALIKLNKVFSDIQNQLLAVPVALILVGGQMENLAHCSAKNVLIWLGALVFAIFMSLLIRNQRHSLKAVKSEIDQQWAEMEGRHRDVADRFVDSYQELRDRFTHQSRLILVVEFLVGLSFWITTGLLAYYSALIP